MKQRRLPWMIGFVSLLAGVLIAGAVGCNGNRNTAKSGLVPTWVRPASPPPDPNFGSARIDTMLHEAWQKAGIKPAGTVDDAGFLRRVYLDIAGTLPPPEVVVAFVSDTAQDKRAKAVETLLASPHYANRWTDAWDEILIGQVRQNPLDRAAFRRWLHAQFEANTPWDKLVYQLITATGKNSVGGARTAMGGAASDAQTDAEEGVNGAVNWLLKYGRNPQDLSGNASRIFLGVQIQCAQCHDHKTEKWTQADFRSFTACFTQTRAVPVGDRDKGMRTYEVRDIDRKARIPKKNPDREELQAIIDSPPKGLDGTDFSDSDNRRQALASWMISPQNPWFASAIVNRLWAMFLGHGFVEPVDDVRPTNPPNLPELYKALSEDFVRHGYDLKHLIRTICATEAYQQKAAKAEGDTNGLLWPRFRVRPLSPDVLLNTIVAATGLDPVIERVAGERREALRAQMRVAFSFLFDVDEDPAQDDYEGTMSQALFLLNGLVSAAGTSTAIRGNALAELMNKPISDEERIDGLYLRMLSRRPSAEEVAYWTGYVNESHEVVRTDATAEQAPKGKGSKKRRSLELPKQIQKRLSAHPGTAKEQAFEDLAWALLNSSEFFFNH